SGPRRGFGGASRRGPIRLSSVPLACRAAELSRKPYTHVGHRRDTLTGACSRRGDNPFRRSLGARGASGFRWAESGALLALSARYLPFRPALRLVGLDHVNDRHALLLLGRVLTTAA